MRKVAKCGNEPVNVLDLVNILDSENVFDSVNALDSINALDSENELDLVNVWDSVNVFKNVFNSVNVSVGIGRHPSIIVPFDTSPNVSLWYVSNTITDAAGTHEKALDETVGDVST